jgi:hypothetical protein
MAFWVSPLTLLGFGIWLRFTPLTDYGFVCILPFPALNVLGFTSDVPEKNGLDFISTAGFT